MSTPLTVAHIPTMVKAITKRVQETLIAPLQEQIGPDAFVANLTDANSEVAKVAFDQLVKSIGDDLLRDGSFIAELAKQVSRQQREFRQSRDEERRETILEIVKSIFPDIPEAKQQLLAGRIDSSRTTAEIPNSEWKTAIEGWINVQREEFMRTIVSLCRANIKIDLTPYATSLLWQGLESGQTDDIRTVLETIEEVKPYLKKVR